MRMSAGTAKAGVPPWPGVPRSGCTTGGWETPCAYGCTRNRGRTTLGLGGAWYGRVREWSSPRCRTCGTGGCGDVCRRCPAYVFSVRGLNICRIHREYRKFLLNLHQSWEWMFLCNLLIVNCKDTKNISFPQLFQRFSYTELTYFYCRIFF